MPHVASSVEQVPHSRIRELAEIAMSMEGVLRLYFGESNLPTPDFIKRAAIEAMADGYTFYTENAGLPSLRRAIARNIGELHSVELDPATEIVITASGVQALERRHPRGARSGRRSAGADAGLAQRLVQRGHGQRHVRQIPASALWRSLRHRLRRAGSGRHAAHAPAAVHLAVESVGLGGHRGGAAAPAGFLPPARAVADGRRSLRPAVLCGRPAGSAGALHPAQGHARRCGDGGAVVFEDLLHDRLARGLAGGAPRPGAQGHAVERIHHFARAQLRAEGRRDSRWRRAKRN